LLFDDAFSIEFQLSESTGKSRDVILVCQEICFAVDFFGQESVVQARSVSLRLVLGRPQLSDNMVMLCLRCCFKTHDMVTVSLLQVTNDRVVCYVRMGGGFEETRFEHALLGGLQLAPMPFDHGLRMHYLSM